VRRAPAILVALAMLGCARNAILELSVRDDNAQANGLDVTLGELEPGGGCVAPGMPDLEDVRFASADTASRLVADVSLVTENPRPFCVWLRVVSVSGAVRACNPLVVQRRAWFLGQRTTWTVDIDSRLEGCGVSPTGVVDVCREVCCEGVPCCGPDDPLCACDSETGRHFCE
jgi:hypothetical protein